MDYPAEEDRYREALMRLGPERVFEPEEAIDEAPLGLRRLEEIFGGTEGLAELAPEHPALAQHRGLKQAIEAAGHATWPNELEHLEQYAEVIVDSTSWAPAPPYEDV